MADYNKIPFVEDYNRNPFVEDFNRIPFVKDCNWIPLEAIEKPLFCWFFCIGY